MKRVIVESVDRAVEAGKRIEAIKTKLKKGEYEPWVRENEDFTTRTAHTYRMLHHYSLKYKKIWKPLRLMGTTKLACLVNYPEAIIKKMLQQNKWVLYKGEPAIALVHLTMPELEMVANKLMGIPMFVPDKVMNGFKNRVGGVERQVNLIIQHSRHIPREFKHDLGERLIEAGNRLMSR